MSWIWVIPALPLLGFLILAVLGGRMHPAGVAAVGTGSVGLSMLAAIFAVWTFWISPPAGGTRDVHAVGVGAGGQLLSVRLPHHGRTVRGHDPGGHGGRFPDPPVLGAVHDGGGRLQPVLRLHEPLRRLHADPGDGGQPAPPVPGLGRGGVVQLPADRILVHRPGQRPCSRERRSSSPASATFPSSSAFSSLPPTWAALTSRRWPARPPASGRRARPSPWPPRP